MFKFSSNIFKVLDVFHLKIVYSLTQYYIQHRHEIYFNVWFRIFLKCVYEASGQVCISR